MRTKIIANTTTNIYLGTSFERLHKIAESGGIIPSRSSTVLADKLVGAITETDQVKSRSITYLDRTLLKESPSWLRLWGLNTHPEKISKLEHFFMGHSEKPEVYITIEAESKQLTKPGIWKKWFLQPHAVYQVGIENVPSSDIKEILIRNESKIKNVPEELRPKIKVQRLHSSDILKNINYGIRLFVLLHLFLSTPAMMLWNTNKFFVAGEFMLSSILCLSAFDKDTLKAFMALKNDLKPRT